MPRLPVVVPVREARHLAKHERRASRGSGPVRMLLDLADRGVDAEPTPELAAQVAEECRQRPALSAMRRSGRWPT